MRRHVIALMLVTGGALPGCARPAALVPPPILLREPSAPQPPITFVQEPTARRVDVLVDGQPFTSYVWPDRLAKPVLYPLRTSDGRLITRGFPFDPRAGERTDHPHHVGLWFNHGDVDGVDFWNHSEAQKPERRATMGRIVHRAIQQARGGQGRGELTVTSDWTMPDGRVAVEETTHFLFTAAPGRRTIDRVATLTARDRPVTFRDNKEGLLGLRLARALELPGKGGDPAITRGQYRSSEGKIGGEVWGTRARWVMLTAIAEGRPVTVALLDHPSNPGSPTHWHARGYGLFAANPLGRAVFTKGAERLDLSLAPGAQVRFGYRVLIASHTATAEEIEAEWQRFSADALRPAF